MENKDQSSPDRVKEVVREKYAKIAATGGIEPCKALKGEQGIPQGFVGEHYTDKQGHVGEADLGLGCGIPTDLADISVGDTVVDLGSGAGNDAFVARKLVGDEGRVIGVDMTIEMLTKARETAQRLGYDNVEFVQGDIDNNPLEEATADVVVSNCVFNLIPEKEKSFAEVFRILKPNGHFSISDIVTWGNPPESLLKAAQSYAGCIAGTISIDEYLRIVREAGFVDFRIGKKRAIDVPEDYLREHAQPSDFGVGKSMESPIMSVTVCARKPDKT